LGYSPGMSRCGGGEVPGEYPLFGVSPGILPRSGRNRFQIPRVRPGVSPGYSPGTVCTMGVGKYFDCHITQKLPQSSKPLVARAPIVCFCPVTRSRPSERVKGRARVPQPSTRARRARQRPQLTRLDLSHRPILRNLAWGIPGRTCRIPRNPWESAFRPNPSRIPPIQVFLPPKLNAYVS